MVPVLEGESRSKSAECATVAIASRRAPMSSRAAPRILWI